MFSDKEVILFQLAKRSQRILKFGYNNVTQILGMTLKFVDSDIVLRNLLCLNKELNEILMNDALKQSLIRV